jgi:hypothetical protein
MVALVAFESSTDSVSLGSSVRSPTTSTVIVRVVEAVRPVVGAGAKVSVPVVAT